MLIRVVAIGRLKAGPERDLVRRYEERAVALGRRSGFAGPDIVELVESRARRNDDRMADEAARIRERAEGAAIICLDERGPPRTSESFAAGLSQARDVGRTATVFVIGGPDGLDPAFRDACDALLSFGALTLPHGIVRVLLLEQIYRAFTIICGHPYHRAGGGA